MLRDSGSPVPSAALAAAWADQVQLARALDGLVADGLADPLPDGRYALPGPAPAAELAPTAGNPGRGPGFLLSVSRGRRRCRRRPGCPRCPPGC